MVHSEETKRKISETKRGKPGHSQSEEARRKISEAKRGKKHGPMSEEQKRKLSESQKGKVISEETIEKRRTKLLGHIVSEETKHKIGKANQGRVQTEAANQKRREASLKLASDPEYLAKVSAGVRKANENPETHINRAKSMSIVHRNKKRTSIEVAVAQVLDALGVKYQQQKRMGRYSVDFYVPSRKLVIECDGDYWHTKPGVKERDARKDIWLREQGYTVLRLLEKQIRKSKFDELYNALE